MYYDKYIREKYKSHKHLSQNKEENVMVPTITKMEVWPVAGKDCMELNLSGAHAPYFTRNVVVLYADNLSLIHI